jgi:ribosomal protein S18 acetylase RimI-like enzyme
VADNPLLVRPGVVAPRQNDLLPNAGLIRPRVAPAADVARFAPRIDAVQAAGMGRVVNILGDGTIHADGEEVGRIKLDQTGGASRIANVEIWPSYRNQGLGSEVIRQVQERAAADGLPVVLTTDAMRGKAAQVAQRRLYERLGFGPNVGPDAVRERIGKRWVAEEMVWRGEPPE